MSRPSAGRRQAELAQAMLRDAVGRRITLVLGEHGLDKAPLDWVIAELNVPEQPARDAIARHPGLGIIDRDGQPVVWSTHPAPIAAGFRPVLDGDRLMLRLPGHRPLFISGEHLGAVPAEQIVDGVDELRLGEPGVGELGYAVARMALMARRWLAVPRPPAAEAQRAQWLFERIADAWRRNPGPIASVRKLRLHRVALGSSVGRPYWLGDETTNQLEIVTWTDEHARTVLVNAYPSRTERPLFHRAAISHSVNSVVAVGLPDGAILGTGVVVRPDTVLTARHVVDGILPAALHVDGHPVQSILTLPLRRFGHSRERATRSAERFAALAETATGTVDLALLTVPALGRPAADLRARPVQPGERLVVAGYPTGQWAITSGPATGIDGADFVVHVMLGPGASGAPAIDASGQVAGVVSTDHLSAGAIVIGSELISEFIEAAARRRPRSGK